MAKADNFPGFEMLFRVHAPGAGRVTCLFKAESDAQIFEHFAPWRAQYGIEMDFTPVIGCQDVVDHHKKLFRQNELVASAKQPAMTRVKRLNRAGCINSVQCKRVTEP